VQHVHSDADYFNLFTNKSLS